MDALYGPAASYGPQETGQIRNAKWPLHLDNWIDSATETWYNVDQGRYMLMTDSEKLDLLLSEVQVTRKETREEIQQMHAEIQQMHAEIQEIHAEIQQMHAENQEMRAESQEMRSQIQDLWAETHDMKKDIQEIGRKVNRLEAGQAELKREIYRIDRKISDTYNLALDAWGQGVENRAWLEESLQKV